ncbi:flagellar assembly protein FliH, partial [Methylobacterium trifolii]
MAAIGEAARTALQHLRGVPHLVVRVHDGLVEEAETLMKRLARERGYEGRLVVLGDPDLSPGDARIEWADGGIVRERARIEATVLASLGLDSAADSLNP